MHCINTGNATQKTFLINYIILGFHDLMIIFFSVSVTGIYKSDKMKD